MSKNHKPGGFDRSVDYKSDLEIAEEAGTRINTSFASGNHNVYVHNAEHTHEHFWYDPENCSSGYHGANVETRNNHPNLSTQNTNVGEEKMENTSESVTLENEMEGNTETNENGTEEAAEDTAVDTQGIDQGDLDGGEECDGGLDV